MDTSDVNFMTRLSKSNLLKKIFLSEKGFPFDSLMEINRKYQDAHFENLDSIMKYNKINFNGIHITRGRQAADSLSKIKTLTNQIIISITRDTLDFQKLNDYLSEELKRQQINIDYSLLHYNKDSVVGGFNQQKAKELDFATVSKSTFLPQNQRIKIFFENSALIVLKRGFADMIISLLFIIVIAGSLWYLYKIIKSQKELAEIKNDLINNITHEFKTPIATVSAALEGIENFNATNDPIKTKKYLDISNLQLSKLTNMVEKLLETATLDSEHLLLQWEHVDPEKMLSTLLDKFRSLAAGKDISLEIMTATKNFQADPFHFENAISNLLDNAIKYGGDTIKITLTQDTHTIITVSDNGGHIHADQKDRVFDKFYRIPKGNLHDVKGFGIGLYYSQKIIEKHGGNIHLTIQPKDTRFTVTLK
jgi:two-component system phosphate regulon sensor histidine kinase PhoR